MNKKKIKFLTILMLIVLFIVLVLGLVFRNFKKNEQNKNIDSVKQYEYVLLTDKSDDNSMHITRIYTFSNDKCIDCKMVWKFTTEEKAKECYDNWKNIEENKNLKIENTTENIIVSFYAESEYGRTLEDILKNVAVTADEYIKL